MNVIIFFLIISFERVLNFTPYELSSHGTKAWNITRICRIQNIFSTNSLQIIVKAEKKWIYSEESIEIHTMVTLRHAMLLSVTKMQLKRWIYSKSPYFLYTTLCKCYHFLVISIDITAGLYLLRRFSSWSKALCSLQFVCH